MKRCYYEILEVDRKATPAQIKTSYRKLALKYHPDKNSEADAKQRFVEINDAYNVLSDPNERTWYDNNRDKVLFNKDEMSKEDLEQYSFGFNIWAYFTMSCFSGYEDDEKGFYAVYRDAFEKIKAEETKAYVSREDLTQEQRKFEGFGNAQTVEEKVLKFYDDWENFTTYKSFVWIQEWDTRDANSRWVRRQMEKENKKQRQGEKKTFLKTVKDLVAYVKKRDPRFREYVVKQKEEEEKKNLERLERQKEKKKEKEEMKIVKQRLEEERFREIEEYYKRQSEQTQQAASRPAHDDDDEDCQFFCEACEKGFKSQNQLRNHEKSKQHKQMIKDIEKEVLLREERMRKAEMEEAVVPETKAPEPEEQPQESPKKKNKKKKKKNQAQQEEDKPESEDEEPVPVPPPAKPKAQPAKQPEKIKVEPKKEERSSSSDDDDRFMSTLLNNRNKKVETKDTKGESKTATEVKKEDKKKKEAAKAKVDSEQSEEQEGEQQRLNKAKLKKQKKAEQQKEKGSTGPKCNVCNSVFTSKTKLFEHITKTGHASTK